MITLVWLNLDGSWFSPALLTKAEFNSRSGNKSSKIYWVGIVVIVLAEALASDHRQTA